MSAVKYHISPENGPMVCSAKISCKFGADTPHYTDPAVAQKVYEEQLEKKNNGVFTKMKKPRPPKVTLDEVSPISDKFTPKLKKLDAALENADFQKVEAFAASSPENHALLNDLIEARAAHAYATHRKIDLYDPKHPDCSTPITATNAKSLRSEVGLYSNQTAMLVEAYSNSPYYTPTAQPLPNSKRLGKAVQATKYEQTDPRWYTSRFNTVGGSDVGVLVAKDFTPEEELDSLTKARFKQLEKSKTEFKDVTLSEDGEMREPSRKGAAYRGSMWEQRIQDSFAKDHPEYKVYSSKSQYVHPEHPELVINVDGVLSDREDGEPNGILEIKTGSEAEKWKDGVPANYRAQVLYYMEVTGMKNGRLRALINDSEVRDYSFHIDDEVYPGSGVKMKDYIENSVLPWFSSIRSKRLED